MPFGAIGLIRRTRTFREKSPNRYIIPDVSYVAGAVVLVLVADYLGRVLGELQGDISGISWRRNQYGQMTIALANPGNLRREMIAIGNKVLVQFDNGLPAWGGVMDLPRQWGYGFVTLNVYSGELLLNWRVTNRSRVFIEVAGGTIFRALLKEMTEPILLELGAVWDGGSPLSAEFHFTDLYRAVSETLAGRTESADWDVTTFLDNGRIRMRANFYRQKGTARPNVRLIEGHNISISSLDQQGPLVNQWLLAGAGTGWNEDSRAYASAYDPESALAYGLRQAGQIETDIALQSLLTARAEVRLDGSKQPYPALSVEAIDRAPARFRDYGIGDSLTVELYSFLERGLVGSFTVEGRNYQPKEGICSLVLV